MKTERTFVNHYLESIAYANYSTTLQKLRIDVVLQATGFHGWNFSRGWANTLKREGLLHRIFTPIAEWGATEPSNDDGLFEYLKNPQADLMLLLGFDWHSQPLHTTLHWQERWQNAPIKKIVITQEHYSAKIVQDTPAWQQLFSAAMVNTFNCIDGLICGHEPDVEFLKIKDKFEKPIIYLPFAIDRQCFRSESSFYSRANLAFFRGNAANHYESNSYIQRQNLMNALSDRSDTKICALESNALSDPLDALAAYTDELRSYRLLLNLPSHSYSLTSRAYEIMGCGGLLLQNKPIGEISQSLFEDWEHLVYYEPSDANDLISKIKYLIKNPQLTRQIADRGYELCHREHILEHRIKTTIDWVDRGFDPKFDPYCLIQNSESRLNLAIDLDSPTDVDLLNHPKTFKVSAIVSTYNSEEFIQGCLQDLVEQTLYQQGELEIVVIDSCSKENEREIVEEFQSLYPHIIYKRTSEREPLYTAWNRAIKLARGRYITNANTDDRHRFDALEKMATYLDRNLDISLVYTDQLISTTPNDLFATTRAENKWNWPPYTYEQMKLGCCVGSQPMWRKSLHDRYGYFREEFKCCGDYEFWMRIGSQGEKMTLIPAILGLYYFNPKGLEHGVPGQTGQECDLICDEYQIPRLYVPKQSGTERKLSDLQYQGMALTEEEREDLALMQRKNAKIFPKVAIDGVFFQINATGIARIWRSLFEEWIESGFAAHIVVLDRNKTAPILPGIEYRNIETYDYTRTGKDSQMLQFVCDEIGADLFISSYYTTPLSTPSVFMAYDMIPEVIEANLQEPMWQEKHHGIVHACRYISISQSTANDLVKFYPQVAPDSIEIAYCGIPQGFSPAPSAEVRAFKAKHKIKKDYLLLIGSRMSLNGYKNAILLFRALQEFPQRNALEIVCVGGEYNLEPELAVLAADIPVHLLRLDDEMLRVAFTGAMALVYPSRYEGFGLPIAEAMACGCPVITCQNSSIPEVAGDAAIYVDEDKIDELVDALSKVQNPEFRQTLIERGFERVKQFSWKQMAEIVADVLMRTANEVSGREVTQTSLVWPEFRKMQAQLQELQLQPKFVSQLQGTIIINSEQPPSIEEKISIAKSQLQQKQYQLAEVEARLETVETEYQLKKLPLLIGAKLRPKLVPFVSLLIGLNLFLFLNIEVIYHPRSQLLLWSELTENLWFVVGTNLLSATLLLGIVGYYTKIDPQKLRSFRSIVGVGGAISIALSLLQYANR
jgi:glycosyltransferase involved in cell wall biosynthesis